MKFGQILTTSQKLSMTQSIIHSIELLQMDQFEISEFIDKLVYDNPLIERLEASNKIAIPEEILNQCAWTFTKNSPKNTLYNSLSYDVYENSYSTNSSNEDLESLSFFLKDQISRLNIPEKKQQLLITLLSYIDNNGFIIDEDLDYIACNYNIDSDDLTDCLNTLKSLEPKGIGCSGTEEFLLLQAENDSKCNSLVIDILKYGIEKLAKKQFHSLANTFHCTTEEIEDAKKYISELKPFPISIIQSNNNQDYIFPDAYVIINEKNQIEIIFSEYFQPEIHINQYYLDLLQNTADKETRNYLKNKISEATDILQSLNKRKDTFRRCVEAIINHQKDFIINGKDLNPLSQQEIAASLGVHESTISRAIRGKYIQIYTRSFPLKYFFTKSVASGEISVSKIKKEIDTIIKSENKAKPLSDEKIRSILGMRGISIQRRTITKYRTELGYPGTSDRKATPR